MLEVFWMYCVVFSNYVPEVVMIMKLLGDSLIESKLYRKQSNNILVASPILQKLPTNLLLNDFCRRTFYRRIFASNRQGAGRLSVCYQLSALIRNKIRKVENDKSGLYQKHVYSGKCKIICISITLNVLLFVFVELFGLH